VLILFVIVIFTSKAYALDISAPETVTVFDKTSFLVEINNPSNSAVNLSVNVFAPVKVEVVVPNQIAPNSKATARVTVYNKFSDEREVNATIEAITNNETVQKEIVLVFKPKANSNFSQDATKVLSGLFSFSLGGGELSSFTLTDWVLFWILVIVAAVLVVAFIARVVKRGN
jgi:hypothetical protein